ncbi:MAG TPA: heparinase II/III family protein [Caulobacteraceae bacterium]
MARPLQASPLDALWRQARREWRAGPLHRMTIAGAAPQGLAVRPRDPRPVDAAAGERLLAGDFRFAGERMEVGREGDPWRRPTPSRRFAAALHGFDWAPDLLAVEGGAPELLRLWLEWRRLFGRFNAFAWSGRALERRVFHLACASPALIPLASEAEGAAYLADLARQARHLLGDPDGPGRDAEQATAAALAGASLAGKAGEALLNKALARLEASLPKAVLRDGVHASRSPERGLELLFDLVALDDALSQRGAPTPAEMGRAIDRLAGAVRFFTHADGRLAAFHGGGALQPAYVAAAQALVPSDAAPPKFAPYGGYHRLEAAGLQAIVDSGPPPAAPWAADACLQPGAFSLVCDGRRLVTASVWAAGADMDVAVRGPSGGSCLGFADFWPEISDTKAERQETGDAVWLEAGHDGWRFAFGLACTRRFYLDGAGELRGEEMVAPIAREAEEERRSLEIRFHLAPGVAAQVAADGHSALLRAAGGAGWRLRTDAAAIRLEAWTAIEDGQPRASQVLVLAGIAHISHGATVRWKLERDAR